jgi:hypothetical protein
MAEKSLIIGAITNYDFDKVAPWVKSINETGFVGDKIMIVFNSTLETVEKLVQHDFKVVVVGTEDKENKKFTYQSGLPIHVERFFHIYNILKDNWEYYDYVITTDVKDIIFQSNPVDWLKENLNGKKLVAGSEAIQYMNEPWGNQNLLETYGQYFYNQFRDCEIYNVGTLGGESEYMKDLCLNIFLSAVNRPIPIVDQAVFNVLIQTLPFRDVVQFARQRDGWACQAGTTVDPSKIESFRPHLLEEEPDFIDGYVYTSTGKKFCIVHQYDRVPEWRKIIEARYK